MAEPKTKRSGASVDTFLARVVSDARRRDCLTLLRIMKPAYRRTRDAVN